MEPFRKRDATLAEVKRTRERPVSRTHRASGDGPIHRRTNAGKDFPPTVHRGESPKVGLHASGGGPRSQAGPQKPIEKAEEALGGDHKPLPTPKPHDASRVAGRRPPKKPSRDRKKAETLDYDFVEGLENLESELQRPRRNIGRASAPCRTSQTAILHASGGEPWKRSPIRRRITVRRVLRPLVGNGTSHASEGAPGPGPKAKATPMLGANGNGPNPFSNAQSLLLSRVRAGWHPAKCHETRNQHHMLA